MSLVCRPCQLHTKYALRHPTSLQRSSLLTLESSLCNRLGFCSIRSKTCAESSVGFLSVYLSHTQSGNRPFLACTIRSKYSSGTVRWSRIEVHSSDPSMEFPQLTSAFLLANRSQLMSLGTSEDHLKFYSWFYKLLLNLLCHQPRRRYHPVCTLLTRSFLVLHYGGLKKLRSKRDCQCDSCCIRGLMFGQRIRRTLHQRLQIRSCARFTESLYCQVRHWHQCTTNKLCHRNLLELGTCSLNI